MSRSTSQASSVTGAISTSLTRSTSVKTTAKPARNVNPLSSSDAKILVTNLRLLNLDLQPDWPNISVQALSSKNVDQKQRISGVEWALFRLFEIWDPIETSQKLQPFFPPLEPLQSLNLRAALYRCLNDLKKNGVLGRETVLRKTMLDDCKGEKFLEILALFSTLVLKKRLAAQPGNKCSLAVARQYSTASALSNAKLASLLPLAIAHKASLVNVLKQKDEKRRRYTEFEALLCAKEEKINVSIRHAKDTPRSRKTSIPDKDAAAIKKQLNDNWIGDHKWLHIILHGDDAPAEDAFLIRRFESVWQMVENGRKPENAVPDAGLLENLQSRVHEQQARLQEWKRFHERLCKEESIPPNVDAKSKTTSKEFKFDDHLQYQISKEPPSEAVPPSAPLRLDYQEIISNMDAELDCLSKTGPDRPSMRRRASSFGASSKSPRRRRVSRSDSVSKSLARGVTEKAANLVTPSKEKFRESFQLLPRHNGSAITPIDSDATLIGHPSTMLGTAPTHLQPSASSLNGPQADSAAVENTLDAFSTAASSIHEYHSSPPLSLLSPQPLTHFSSEPPELEPPPVNHEDVLAEQLISSMSTATPSPVKKPQQRLSLVERTRMSMAHTSTFQPIMESPAMDSPPLPQPVEERPEPFERRESLLDRTRLSMAAMSQNPRPPPKKDTRRTGSRQSLFPVNQFDTPRNRRSIQAIEEAKSGGSTPKEELFSDEIDYDRVFKSRPRVAHSPIFSPEELQKVRHDAYDGNGTGETDGDVSGLGIDGDEFNEGVTGVDLADVDRDSDDDGFTKAWENSPLRRAGTAGAGQRSARLFG